MAPDISSEPAGAAQDRDNRSAPVCRRDRPEAPRAPTGGFIYSDSHTPPAEKVGE